MKDKAKSLLRILFSVSISALILFALFQLFRPEALGDEKRLLPVLKNALVPLLAFGLACTIGQSVLRAIRYGVLLSGSGEPRLPGFGRLLLVTLTRNMFVDLLPARIGELSYIAMLNRGYQVRADTCVSSLAVSLLFDFVGLIAVVGILLIAQAFLVANEAGLWALFIGLALLITLGSIVLFFGFKRISFLAQKALKRLEDRIWLKRILEFLLSTSEALDRVQTAGVMFKTFWLSIAIRVLKYGGIYSLFLAVTGPSLPDLSGAPASSVLVALISSEAAASLPIPAFMSFGTYESGGTMAFVGLGFPAHDAALALLGVHIYSQLMDYTLGLAGFLLFMFRFSRPFYGPRLP